MGAAGGSALSGRSSAIPFPQPLRIVPADHRIGNDRALAAAAVVDLVPGRAGLMRNRGQIPRRIAAVGAEHRPQQLMLALIQVGRPVRQRDGNGTAAERLDDL